MVYKLFSNDLKWCEENTKLVVLCVVISSSKEINKGSKTRIMRRKKEIDTKV